MPDVNYENTGTFRTDLHSSAHRNGPYDTEGFRKDVSSLGRIALRAEPTWADSGLPSSNKSHENNGAVPDGWRNTSRRGGSYGNTLRTARGRGDLEGPNFNIAVPPNGYAWWYVDGISDTTERAISIIGFIGSVFSPWYRWSGRKNPENHVCINVATYGPGGRFTMTDRGQSALRQSPSKFQVGPSSMRWNGDHLIIDVNEIGSPPLISRVKGQIIVTPSAVTDVELPLTTDGAHIWRPFAPTSRISVDLNSKGWQWEDTGILTPILHPRLEEDFPIGHGDGTDPGSTCFYDATRLNGSKLAAAVQFDEKGRACEIPLPQTRLKRSLSVCPRNRAMRDINHGRSKIC